MSTVGIDSSVSPVTQEDSERGKLELALHLLANLSNPLLLLVPPGDGKTAFLRQMQARVLPGWSVCYMLAHANHSYERIIDEMCLLLCRPGQTPIGESSEAGLIEQLDTFSHQGRLMVLLLDNAGVLMPGLLSALCQLSRLHPCLKLVFALTSDEVRDKSKGDGLALAEAHQLSLCGTARSHPGQGSIAINPTQLFTASIRVEPVETRSSTSSGQTVFWGQVNNTSSNNTRWEKPAGPQSDEIQPHRSVWSKPLFWVLGGGVLVLALTVGLVSLLWRESSSLMSPSINKPIAQPIQESHVTTQETLKNALSSPVSDHESDKSVQVTPAVKPIPAAPSLAEEGGPKNPVKQAVDLPDSSQINNQDTNALASTAPVVQPVKPKPACSDTLDNDGDEHIDHPTDPGCASADDTDETDPHDADLKVVQGIDREWEDGYCAHVDVRNIGGKTRTWEVALPIKGQIKEAWGGKYSQIGNILKAKGEGRTKLLKPGSWLRFGFCAELITTPKPAP